MTRRVLFVTAFLLSICSYAAHSQFIQPYAWSIGNDVSLDTNVFGRKLEVAGSRGRMQLNADGHLSFADGGRFRVVGTSLVWTSLFHDSASAVSLAKRLRALGINTVRIGMFDYTFYEPLSILADGTSTDGKLSESQMKKLDWLIYQFKLNGIYTVPTFHGLWMPRTGDGVRQPDSSSWGTRSPLLFDKDVQRVHRTIIKAFFSHVNPYTQTKYADENALAYMIAAESSSFLINWLYTGDIVPNNYATDANGTNVYYARYVGLEHRNLIDSLWRAFLVRKGLSSDAAISKAWDIVPKKAGQILINGGFESKKDSWTFTVQPMTTAKGDFNASETQNHSGQYGAWISVEALSERKSVLDVAISQTLPIGTPTRLHKYKYSFWIKHKAGQSARNALVAIFGTNGGQVYFDDSITVTVTDQWKYHEFEYISSANANAQYYVGVFTGDKIGDLYIDDIDFRELPRPALAPGESIQKGNLPLVRFHDPYLHAGRQAAESEFYQTSLYNMYSNVRKLVRDTIKSKILMCPSTNLYTYFDCYPARDYDIFMTSIADNTARSTSGYDSQLYSNSTNKFRGKAFIPGQNIVFPSAFSGEGPLTTAAYGGLQDWDGMFVGPYSQRTNVGVVSQDSLDDDEIIGRPALLTLLPVISAAMQAGEFMPSTRVVKIDNDSQAVSSPRTHLYAAYGITSGADGRLPAFRRVESSLQLAEEESVSPHLAVSQFSAALDDSKLDAENEQIYHDAIAGVFKIITPNFVAASGKLANQLVQLPGVMIEQTSANEYSTIVMYRQSDTALVTSNNSIIAVSTRSVNADAVYENGAFTKWGTGPIMVEGASYRITLTIPEYDSCRVIPVSSEGMDMRGKAVTYAKSASGKFSIAINSGAAQTGWFRTEFFNVPTTGVEELASVNVSIAPNPVENGVAYVSHPESASSIEVVDAMGRVVGVYATQGSRTTIDMALPSGTYHARISGHGYTKMVSFVKF